MTLAIEPADHSIFFRYIDPANRVAVSGLGLRLIMHHIGFAIFSADHGLDYAVTDIDEQHPDKQSDHVIPFSSDFYHGLFGP